MIKFGLWRVKTNIQWATKSTQRGAYQPQVNRCSRRAYTYTFCGRTHSNNVTKMAER